MTNGNSITIDGGRLSHAYIARGEIADRLAMAAVCASAGGRPCMECAHCRKALRGIHPDVITVKKPDNTRELPVDRIRALKRDVIVAPNEAAKKVYIIENAELMNASAQNALLRILEEPPPHVMFILKTDNPAELLPTVLSRCAGLRSPVPGNAREQPQEGLAAEYFTALSHGGAAFAEFMFRLEKLDREQMTDFISAARSFAAAEMRRTLSGNDGGPARRRISQIEKTLAEACEYLALNVSSGHIAGLICAKHIAAGAGGPPPAG